MKQPEVEDNQDDLFAGYTGQEGELIPILQRVQGRDGYISEQRVSEIARFLRISENQVYGVASFYSQFRFVAPGRNSIRVCLGTACHVRGGQILLDAVQRELGIVPGQTTADRRFDLQRVACVGCCALAPVVQVNDQIYSRVTVLRLKEILHSHE